MFTALKQAWPFLALFGLGVVAVAATRPKGDADVHDLSDHRADAVGDLIWQRTPARAAWPLIDRKPMPARRALRVEPVAQPVGGPAVLVDILPPAPAGMDAGSPLWRELIVETAVPTLSDDEVRDIAARWLREARDDARAEMAGAR